MTKRWYVVHAYSGYEKKVQGALLERIRLAVIEDSFGEILVPTEEVVEMRAGQKRRSERKFFPGYVLINMTMVNETWHIVKSTPKVTGFIGGGQQPMTIPDNQAIEILQQIKDGKLKPKPKVSFEKGDAVSIIDGPFTNFNGFVDEVKPEKGILKVLVSIFGRSTPIELEFLQVKKN